MSENNPGLGISMTEWAVGLQQLGETELAGRIDQDKLTTLRKLAELGLPTYRRHIVGVTDFLENPDSHFGVLERKDYFAILAPKNNTLRRHRIAAATKDRVGAFIGETLTPPEVGQYSLILEEYFEHHYGGNIVCAPDGRVSAEIVAGRFGHNRLVTGQETPQLTMERDEFTGRFSYSFEDQALRRALWRTAMAIPHTTEEGHADEYAARGAKFLPGYYEFYLAKRQPESALEPIFIDYSDQPAFQLA